MMKKQIKNNHQGVTKMKKVQSYILKAWQEGEVEFKGDVAGRLNSSYDFRPLEHKHVEELLEAGLIDSHQAIATNRAYDEDTAQVFANYRKMRANRTPEQIAEERFEMEAAFGKGAEVVNIITGEITKL